MSSIPGPSGYKLVPLREGADFTLYRGRKLGHPSSVLAIAPSVEQPLPAAGTPVARPSRVHRRNTPLHGSRTNRPHESFDRLPERHLRLRRDALRNANRLPAFYGFRSDGMGALSYCKAAGAARRAEKRCAWLCFRNHHEATCQNSRGTLPDGSGR